MEKLPKRFPKVCAPFVRENDKNGYYNVIDEVNEGFSWVFEDEDVFAVEKLHGTNCCVEIEETEQGKEFNAYTRHGYQPMQKVDPYHQTKTHHNITRAFQNSLQRGYLDSLSEGIHYGEVVGPNFHGNAHNLKENLFIPFSWLKDKCSYNSWGKYPKNFESIKDWFENDLFSLFNCRMHNDDIESSSVKNGTFCEGIVFVKEEVDFTENISTQEYNSGQYAENIAKLRRDMFQGFSQGKWPMTKYSNH